MMKTAVSQTGSGIEVFPETDERTLCISLKGRISKEEYENFFLKPLEKIIKKHPHFNLLIHYDRNYKGWDKDAADTNFKNILEYGQNTIKLAYVNPPESKIFQIKLMPPLFGGEIRFFEEEQLDEALKWIKS